MQIKKACKVTKRLFKESDEGVTADLEFGEECGPTPAKKIAPDLEMNEMSAPTAKDTQEMEKIKHAHQEQVSTLKKKLKASQQKTRRLKKGMQL